MSALHEICLTELDVVRLESLLHQLRRGGPREQPSVVALEARVDEARVVHATCVAPDVVTMNSAVELAERGAQRSSEVTLVYPRDADPERSRISVLSPVGRALIGARVGDALRVTVPGGPCKELVVLAIPYQPEAHGRYDL